MIKKLAALTLALLMTLSMAACGSGCGGAQHHRQIQLSRAAQVQRQPRQRTGGRRVGRRPAAHKTQQQHRCQHSRR